MRKEDSKSRICINKKEPTNIVLTLRFGVLFTLEETFPQVCGFRLWIRGLFFRGHDNVNCARPRFVNAPFELYLKACLLLVRSNRNQSSQ